MYVTGYLRIGIMAKRSNKIRDASKWFGRALEVDSKHVETFQLIRMLQSDMAMHSPSSSISTDRVCTK